MQHGTQSYFSMPRIMQGMCSWGTAARAPQTEQLGRRAEGISCYGMAAQAHQIEQLKAEVMAKDAALVKEHFGHVRAEQECDSLRTEGEQARAACCRGPTAHGPRRCRSVPCNVLFHAQCEAPELYGAAEPGSCIAPQSTMFTSDQPEYGSIAQHTIYTSRQHVAAAKCM